SNHDSGGGLGRKDFHNRPSNQSKAWFGIRQNYNPAWRGLHVRQSATSNYHNSQSVNVSARPRKGNSKSYVRKATVANGRDGIRQSVRLWLVLLKSFLTNSYSPMIVDGEFPAHRRR